MFREITLDTITTGTAGTVTSSEPINGVLVGVHLTNNSDGTVTIATKAAPTIPILTSTAAGTQWFHPQAGAHNVNAGTLAYGVGYAVTTPIAIPGDYVTCVVNAAGTVTARLLTRE